LRVLGGFSGCISGQGSIRKREREGQRREKRRFEREREREVDEREERIRNDVWSV